MFNLFKKSVPRRARKPDETGVAIVAMIGNESDIIELFLRHNAPFCDKFYIILHNSFDNTASIIEKMRAEGFDIDVQVSKQIEFDQKKITTALVREVAREGRYDYIIPLDADEFLPYDSSILETIRTLPLNRCGTMDWKTFVPPDSDYFAPANPLLSFHARSSEPIPFTKVVLGGDFAKFCRVAMGNHSAGRGLKKLRRDPIPLNILLQHFPLRSREQMTRKYLLSAYSFSFIHNKILNESAVRRLKEVRTQNYQLDYDFVLDAALKYATTPDLPKNDVPAVDEKVVPKLDKRVKIVYGDLMQINLLADMDRFISKWLASKPR